MLLAFGVAFQLPIIVYGIGIAGLLSTESLLKYWRHAASVIFVLSAIITPSNDPISMLTMAVPLTVLFVASVYAVKFTQRKQMRPEAEDDAPMAVLDMGEPIAYPEENPEEIEVRRETLE
jgi:sec-independent protein translocase protein TatC